jgi:hypothetical protein
MMENGWQFQALQTPLAVILFALAVLVFTGVLSTLNWVRRRGKGVAALELLRFTIVALILFTLCKPEFLRITTIEEKPEVVILKDVSNSTTTRDVKRGPRDVITRAEWLDEQLTTNLWAQIEMKALVTVQDFGMSGTDDPEQIRAGTDIYSALEAQRKKNKNLKAIFLLSDGDWNFGQPPQQAAMKLGAEKIPVFTLTVGSDQAQKDLILESVNPPNFGLLGEQIAIPFRIQSHLDEPVRTTVRLTSSRGPAVSITKPINIPARGQVHDSIVWSPREISEYTLTLEVPVWTKGSEHELLEDNNSQTFQISIRTERLSVLLVESYPRWEYRYLRNALTRDPGVDVSVLLLHPELGPGSGLNYIGKFPETREQLAKFDVVFLGDVGIGEKELTEEQCDLIRGLVDQQGSGLVFMPGQRGRQLTFLNHPLGELIPVTYDANEKEGFWAQREVNFKLTSTGKGHFLTMLAADEFLNDNIWKNLPGFYWCAAVERARPGSQVLATHSSKRNSAGYIPVLATRSWGGGEVLFMGTDAAWRWRRGVEDRFHYRFWGQVVRWMAHKRKMAQGRGVRLTYSPENPKVGDEVFMQATLLDLSGGTLNQSLRASVKAPDGQTRDLAFNALEGGWGVFQENMEVTLGGIYDVTIYNPNGKQELKTEILVEAPTLEKLGQPANTKVMREIALRTGGQSGGPGDLQKLLNEISLVAENEVFEENYRLWDQWWWGGIIVLLLVVYWVSRKMMGLI